MDIEQSVPGPVATEISKDDYVKAELTDGGENMIIISNLPPDVAKVLAPLDLDGDGTISVSEILALRGQERQTTKQVC